MKQILIVEDDHLQSEWIEMEIKKYFPGVQIEKIATEYNFRTKFGDVKKNPPDIILIDVMLRWTDPSPNMIHAPEDVKEEGGHFHAGFRCERLLRQASETKEIPVIFYTVLEENDLEDKLRETAINKTSYVPKDTNPSTLIQAIKNSLTNQDLANKS